MNSLNRTYRSVWLWSLCCFLLAALTGTLYRFGLTGSVPLDLVLSNIRHAHSHLMFFSWVVPVPMMFIAGFVSAYVPQSRKPFRQAIYASLIVGALSWPFFLLYGYQSVQVGSASLPISVILSGLAMIVWYRFVQLYLRYRPSAEAGLTRLLYDASLLMLVVSSLGAWGVAVLQFSTIDNALLSSGMTHFFLTVFTEGWCVLSALGIFCHVNGVRSVPFHESWLVAPIVLGVPLMFPFGISAELLSGQLLMVAIFGGLVVSAGLGAHIYMIWGVVRKRFRWWWVIILNLLIAKVLVQISASLLPSELWLGRHGLRVFYLHLTLLGFVSVLYFAAWHTLFPKIKTTAYKWFVLSVLLLLAGLALISGMLPAGWMPSGIHGILIVLSLIPPAAILFEILAVIRTGESAENNLPDG